MILLALGSNIEPRAEYLAQAQKQLALNGVHVLQASSVIETPALLKEGAPAEWNKPFLNQVLLVSTSHPPKALLALCKRVETALGRIEHGRWGPREIDIDLLAYDALVLQTPSLTLPHPQLHARQFVLAPLREIVPHWRYPAVGSLAGKTSVELLAALS